MRQQSSFLLNVTAEPVLKLADKIDALAQRALLRLSAVDVVNEVATRFEKTARQDMNAGINLSDDYLKRRMELIRETISSKGVARAEIVARGRLTILSRFPYAQLTTAAPRAKGDPKRGIPGGRKQAGVAVEIRRGGAFDKKKWFTMTLRRGTEAGDNVGVFSRGEKNRLEHMHGPAPYSLFRFQVQRHEEDLNTELRNTAVARAADIITKGLA